MGLVRRNVSSEVLLQRAHLGVISNASQLIAIAKEKGICTTPLDVFKLASEVLGIEIVQKELAKDHSGYLEKTTEKKWRCVVNSLHHETRQRFTVAHEIGHFLLHQNDKSTFDSEEDWVKNRSLVDFNGQNPEYERHESEANMFASELLMPSDVFNQMKLIKSEAQLADFFGVSTAAISIRMKLV